MIYTIMQYVIYIYIYVRVQLKYHVFARAFNLYRGGRLGIKHPINIQFAMNQIIINQFICLLQKRIPMIIVIEDSVSSGVALNWYLRNATQFHAYYV